MKKVILILTLILLFSLTVYAKVFEGTATISEKNGKSSISYNVGLNNIEISLTENGQAINDLFIDTKSNEVEFGAIVSSLADKEVKLFKYTIKSNETLRQRNNIIYTIKSVKENPTDRNVITPDKIYETYNIDFSVVCGRTFESKDFTVPIEKNLTGNIIPANCKFNFIDDRTVEVEFYSDKTIDPTIYTEEQSVALAQENIGLDNANAIYFMQTFNISYNFTLLNISLFIGPNVGPAVQGYYWIEIRERNATNNNASVDILAISEKKIESALIHYAWNTWVFDDANKKNLSNNTLYWMIINHNETTYNGEIGINYSIGNIYTKGRMYQSRNYLPPLNISKIVEYTPEADLGFKITGLAFYDIPPSPPCRSLFWGNLSTSIKVFTADCNGDVIALGGYTGRSFTVGASTLASTEFAYLDGISTYVYRQNGTDVLETDGGTGRSSHTAYGLIAGSTSGTGAETSIANSATVNTILMGAGTSAYAVWSTAVYPKTIATGQIPFATSANEIGNHSSFIYSTTTGLWVNNTINVTRTILQSNVPVCLRNGTNCNVTNEVLMNASIYTELGKKLRNNSEDFNMRNGNLSRLRIGSNNSGTSRLVLYDKGFVDVDTGVLEVHVDDVNSYLARFFDDSVSESSAFFSYYSDGSAFYMGSEGATPLNFYTNGYANSRVNIDGTTGLLTANFGLAVTGDSNLSGGIGNTSFRTTWAELNFTPDVSLYLTNGSEDVTLRNINATGNINTDSNYTINGIQGITGSWNCTSFPNITITGGIITSWKC